MKALPQEMTTQAHGAENASTTIRITQLRAPSGKDKARGLTAVLDISEAESVDTRRILCTARISRIVHGRTV